MVTLRVPVSDTCVHRHTQKTQRFQTIQPLHQLDSTQGIESDQSKVKKIGVLF